MTPQLAHQFVSELGQALSVTELLKIDGVRVKCVQVHKRIADEAPEQNFLNSFIADDLLNIEQAVLEGDVGAGIASYLHDTASIRADYRVDVRHFPDAVVAGVAPDRTPAGRWPTGIDRPLVMSQQFAVNTIMNEFAATSGVFAVNGPPGTGKTTMLRDVLAAIVVDRAQRIADLRLAHPIDAFSETAEPVRVGQKYNARVHSPRTELTGSEIVVATAGNKAATNITEEIPGIDAVRGAEQAACDADYFTDLATNVVGADAWGLVAAKLGKRSNRSSFVKNFWWGDQTSRGEESGRERPELIKGMRDLLKDAEPLSADSWAQSVRRFNEARDEVERLAADRQHAAEAISRIDQCRGRVPMLRAAIATAKVEVIRYSADLESARTDLGAAEETLNQARAARDEHGHHQPNFWVSLSTFFRAGREWHARAVELNNALEDAKAAAKQGHAAITHYESALNQTAVTRQQQENELQHLENEVAALRGRVEQSRAQWPGHVPNPADFATDAFQLCAPWADAEFTEARNRLFLEALRLHKTFILGARARLKGNLEVAMEVLRRGLPTKPEILRTVWQSFFLVVPVVSTTFASLPQLFRGLGREAIGWLLVDEAGQATPQQVLGGIWRARRSVIVGDPQQLEPIVALPLSAQHALRRNNNVAEQWMPGHTSAQRIADRLARFGTYLPDSAGDNRVWVGAPLRVHRRCERLMFRISNDIAYGGDLMIYGTKVTGDFPGSSAWIDVHSGASEGNWVPDEGLALSALLEELKRDGVRREDIRVISPFRDAVRGAKDITGRLRWPFAGDNVGTVHTVQGQESNVIILVLGSAPRNFRAREWAAETPNLLNVAVSRAKRRLYVIGNRTLWKDQRFFDTLAARLPVRTRPMEEPADDALRQRELRGAEC